MLQRLPKCPEQIYIVELYGGENGRLQLTLNGVDFTADVEVPTAMLGEERQGTQQARADDSRGRHTTVRRELILTPKGWLLIDTPGLRELQLWATSAGIDRAFGDIASLARDCRFRNCRHDGEPGCAVAAAGIDQARLASYTKLQRELAHLDRKQDQRAALEEKRKIKRIHRAMRDMYRD